MRSSVHSDLILTHSDAGFFSGSVATPAFGLGRHPSRARPRFAAVSCMGFLAWSRARAQNFP
jgi:hypothetical protein